jgi:DNA-binding transcriptional LysR family regulator
MELRQLRYFVAVGEEQHYGRAAQHLRVAQPALSRQIQNLEEEIGFKLFERLPRGVKITDAGKLLLDDARRMLQEVNDAIARAKRIAAGQSGTLRIGFVESISWQGIVPDSLRDFREHQPDVELQLKSLRSLDQIAAIHSGSLDAGYALPMANPDHGLAHFQMGIIKQVLAVPLGHPLTKQKHIRLRDLTDTPFIWFPRWAIPNAYDRLRAACARGGLKAPRIVQETAVETMILSLVQCSVGVAFISSAARWRCPPGVTLLPVADLNVTFPFALMWRQDNNSPLLAKFTADVKSLVERGGRKDEILG